MIHVLARVVFLKDIAHPKSSGVVSGYIPLHKFPARFPDILSGGRHDYFDEEVHMPGENLEARIAFVSWEHIGDKIQVGDKFEIHEVDRMVGEGTIVDKL